MSGSKGVCIKWREDPRPPCPSQAEETCAPKKTPARWAPVGSCRWHGRLGQRQGQPHRFPLSHEVKHAGHMVCQPGETSPATRKAAVAGPISWLAATEASTGFPVHLGWDASSCQQGQQTQVHSERYRHRGASPAPAQPCVHLSQVTGGGEHEEVAEDQEVTAVGSGSPVSWVQTDGPRDSPPT